MINISGLKFEEKEIFRTCPTCDKDSVTNRPNHEEIINQPEKEKVTTS